MSGESTLNKDSLSSELESSQRTVQKPNRIARALGRFVPLFLKDRFYRLDRHYGGSISFFFRHYGKTRFMLAMSKKIQYLGIERVFLMDRLAFTWFFMLYLVRDVILYIAIPIFIARLLLS